MALDDEPSVKYPSQPLPTSDGRNPHVMIVGAGLGAVMTLNAGVFPALEQLGLHEELVKLSLPATWTSVYHGDMTEIITLKTKLADV
ncbi:hypothetical protein BGX30_013817 [Mortierella sp. GBA39]|nr:hypothetical protein BGX30_013817 [Mortierella sp. GBA39]